MRPRNGWTKTTSAAAYLLAAVFLTSSCGTAEGGGDGSTTEPPTTSRDVESVSKENNSDLAEKKACEMLTRNNRENLNLRKGEPQDIGTARSCVYMTRGSPIESIPVAIDIREEQSLDSFNEAYGEATDTRIEERRAKIQCSYGNCLIAIRVDDQSRVDVTATDATDQRRARELATRTARTVIGNLPRQ
ncbi:DUF3558 family protein [Actinopolyspora erythraea]|nr:DUF3558 family protein [Actinopolyspora erythraea]